MPNEEVKFSLSPEQDEHLKTVGLEKFIGEEMTAEEWKRNLNDSFSLLKESAKNALRDNENFCSEVSAAPMGKQIDGGDTYFNKKSLAFKSLDTAVDQKAPNLTAGNIANSPSKETEPKTEEEKLLSKIDEAEKEVAENEKKRNKKLWELVPKRNKNISTENPVLMMLLQMIMGETPLNKIDLLGTQKAATLPGKVIAAFWNSDKSPVGKAARGLFSEGDIGTKFDNWKHELLKNHLDYDDTAPKRLAELRQQLVNLRNLEAKGEELQKEKFTNPDKNPDEITAQMKALETEKNEVKDALEKQLNDPSIKPALEKTFEDMDPDGKKHVQNAMFEKAKAETSESEKAIDIKSGPTPTL